jgi:hypothetical protein
MYIKDDQVVTEAHDYITVWEGGYKQRKLTPSALQQHARLRQELQTRQASQKKTDVAEMARKIRAEKAEKARLEQEARQKAAEARQAEMRAKIDEELTRKLKMANTGISDEQIAEVLPEMRRKHQIEQAEKVSKQFAREALAKWGAE